MIIELALTAPQPEAVRGDFNQDQKINGKDLKLLLRNLGKKITDSNSQFDLNDDGRISLLDTLIWALWLAQSKHS